MNKHEAIIIGWINKGKTADCGETMKNQLMIQRLEKLGIKCRPIDFKNWRKHPWVFLELAWNMLIHKDNTVIMSSSAINIYPMLKFLKLIRWKQNLVHWVIGGNLDSCIEKGVYKPEVLDYPNWTLVESELLQKRLQAYGIHNVLQVPNFKPIFYYPDIRPRFEKVDKKIRFVFLSRIIPEKGCGIIINSARLLNDNGYSDKFIVDFYGKIAETYKTEFLNSLSNIGNVSYKGFLDLRTPKGYDLLASYDMMLFPTYWKGEGFAGIFMDAFISGLPLIASDWGHNRYILKEQEVALFVSAQDKISLYNAMLDCINGKINLVDMAICSQHEARKYDIDNVITNKLLREINIIE